MYAFLFFVFALFGRTEYGHTENVQTCHCRWSGKDYDAAKGYYFERFEFWPYWSYASKFACQYRCTDDRGQTSLIEEPYSDRYFYMKKGNPSAANENICPHQLSSLTAVRDELGAVIYYEAELLGDFNPLRVPGVSKLKAHVLQSRGCR